MRTNIPSNDTIKNIPTVDVTKVPSGMKSYDDSTVFKIRRYTFGELDEFNQSTLTPVSKIDHVLKGIDCNIDKELINLSDFLYLAMFRKFITIGSGTYVIEVICPTCNKKHRFNIEFSKLDFKELNVPKLPVKLTMTDGTLLEFSPITIKDFKYLLSIGKDTDDGSATLAVQVRNLKYKEAFDKIYFSSNDDDINALREVQKLLEFGVNDVVTKCTNVVGTKKNEETGKDDPIRCDQLIRIDLQLESEDVYIYPFREQEGTTRTTISFG